MAARIAKSLAQLRSEFNAAFPHRSTASDGWIGDPAHASRASRHNPNNFGVVCALDITHDPANGVDIHKYARLYVATVKRLGLDSAPDFEYVISDGWTASRTSGWVWKVYTGTNKHNKHAHFAVGRGPDSEPTAPYDDVYSWHVADLLLPAPTPVPVPEEDEMKIALLVCDPARNDWPAIKDHVFKTTGLRNGTEWLVNTNHAKALAGYGIDINADEIKPCSPRLLSELLTDEELTRIGIKRPEGW